MQEEEAAAQGVTPREPRPIPPDVGSLLQAGRHVRQALPTDVAIELVRREAPEVIRKRKTRYPKDSGGVVRSRVRWCAVQAFVVRVAAEVGPEERGRRIDASLLRLVVVHPLAAAGDVVIDRQDLPAPILRSALRRTSRTARKGGAEDSLLVIKRLIAIPGSAPSRQCLAFGVSCELTGPTHEYDQPSWAHAMACNKCKDSATEIWRCGRTAGKRGRPSPQPDRRGRSRTGTPWAHRSGSCPGA